MTRRRQGGCLWISVWLAAAGGCAPAEAPPREAGPPPRAAQAAPLSDIELSPWRPAFIGVERCEGRCRLPRPMKVHAIRIDLHEPTVDFLVTPSNGKEPKDCTARTTTRFLSEFKCQVAINGTPFDQDVPEGQPQDVLGLSLSRGDLYSRPHRRFSALLISRDHRRAWIAPAPADATGAWNGLGGFETLLLDGRNMGAAGEIHPRSAAGISRDGRYLLLMTIDGRQSFVSEGATTAETAGWLLKLGAWNALNLDGGSSTSLALEGPDGRPVLLNRPSGILELPVANHLGVIARPLPQTADAGSAR